MKRSTQVSLVLMTAAGVGGAAYALNPRDCGQRAAGSAAGNTVQDSGDTVRDCRSHGGARWHLSFPSGSGGSDNSAAAHSTPASAASAHGGFGAIGAGLGAGG